MADDIAWRTVIASSASYLLLVVMAWGFNFLYLACLALVWGFQVVGFIDDEPC